jgi:hypothetical protein
MDFDGENGSPSSDNTFLHYCFIDDGQLLVIFEAVPE